MEDNVIDIEARAVEKRIQERIAALHERRKAIMALEPEAALDQILSERQPAALVHAFPAEDFYFLVHEIGPEDSLELLGLASSRQWEYIMDMEIWQRDRIHWQGATQWLYLMLKADPQRLVRWTLEEKSEFMGFYLYQHLRLFLREHDQDPADLGNELFTHDDLFYIQLIEAPEADSEHGETRRAFLSEYLRRLAEYDYPGYQALLLESAHVIPAEAEEEAYRRKTLRLAEKGFLPFDEAIGLYQPLRAGDIRRGGMKQVHPLKAPLPVPLYPTGMLEPDNLFARALSLINESGVLEELQTEFAGLSNRIISADQAPIRERSELEPVVKKACGYLSIGLERLTKGDLNRAADGIRKYPLERIFRVGFGLAMGLKWRAKNWYEQSWFLRNDLPLGFWDEDGLGLLGGLFLKKPLYYDNFETSGQLYREFATLAEIRRVREGLDQLIAFDRLLSVMPIRLRPVSGLLLTYRSLLLTLWARAYLGMEEVLEPLSLAEFLPFYTALWDKKGAAVRVRAQMKGHFLNWLSERTGLEESEISEGIGGGLERLFEKLESEFGQVGAAELEPRHIYLFLIA